MPSSGVICANTYAWSDHGMQTKTENDILLQGLGNMSTKPCLIKLKKENDILLQGVGNMSTKPCLVMLEVDILSS